MCVSPQVVGLLIKSIYGYKNPAGASGQGPLKYTMSTYIVTGANRGIGLALVNDLSQNEENTVVATTRKFANAKALEDLKRKNVEIIELDVAGTLEDITKALTKSKVLKNGVDVVINNAGVFMSGTEKIIDSKIDNYRYMFDINTLGAVKVFQAIYPYWSIELKADKKFVAISSAAGSNSVRYFNSHGYGMSKAALNYFITEAAIDSKASDIQAIQKSTILSIHPGVVSTDMGSAGIPVLESLGFGHLVISPEESAAALIKVIDSTLADKSGAFLSYDGLEIPF